MQVRVHAQMNAHRHVCSTVCTRRARNHACARMQAQAVIPSHTQVAININININIAIVGVGVIAVAVAVAVAVVVVAARAYTIYLHMFKRASRNKRVHA
jgi:hypothetical protein